MNQNNLRFVTTQVQVCIASFPDTLVGTVAALKEPRWVKKLCFSVGVNDLRNQGTVEADLLYKAKTTFQNPALCVASHGCVLDTMKYTRTDFYFGRPRHVTLGVFTNTMK